MLALVMVILNFVQAPQAFADIRTPQWNRVEPSCETLLYSELNGSVVVVPEGKIVFFGNKVLHGSPSTVEDRLIVVGGVAERDGQRPVAHSP